MIWCSHAKSCSCENSPTSIDTNRAVHINCPFIVFSQRTVFLSSPETYKGTKTITLYFPVIKYSRFQMQITIEFNRRRIKRLEKGRR